MAAAPAPCRHVACHHATEEEHLPPGMGQGISLETYTTHGQFCTVTRCYAMLHSVTQMIPRTDGSVHLLPQDTLHYMMRELQSTEVVQPGIGGVKPIAWSGVRHMISEVSLICPSVCPSLQVWKLLGCSLGWTNASC